MNDDRRRWFLSAGRPAEEKKHRDKKGSHDAQAAPLRVALPGSKVYLHGGAQVSCTDTKGFVQATESRNRRRSNTQWEFPTRREIPSADERLRRYLELLA